MIDKYAVRGEKRKKEINCVWERDRENERENRRLLKDSVKNSQSNILKKGDTSRVA